MGLRKRITLSMVLKIVAVFLYFVSGFCAVAQNSPLFNDLPLGEYPVGFKIITITDSSRVTKPLYNYFGERETGDRYHKISIHTWYPAKPNTGKGKVTYNEYCYNHLLSNNSDQVDEESQRGMISSMRNTLERFFGKITDTSWQQLSNTRMLAQKEAIPVTEKFPLLIGTLRPLSTVVTNELMASNGYVVAMIVSPGRRLPAGYITDVADMQKTIAYLVNKGMADENAIGAYGFSGSGFSQVLLAMDDPRIGALADIESALYGEGIWKIFSSSNYYDVSKLRVPFLHIYGKYLGMRDVSFDEFYRTKYSHRYHLLLNQPGLHHWDVATEGRASAMVLHNRGQLEWGVKASFELANIYLLNFFNAVLKKDKASQKILDTRTLITGYHDTLWTMQQYPALKPPPDKLQFEELIKRKGIDEAIELARHCHKVDATADFVSENGLNHLAQLLQQKNNLEGGIKLMHLATEFYPDKAWLWLNLGAMQETNGDINGAIQSCERVMELLKDLQITGLSFNERIKKSAMDTLKRLKKT